MVYSVLEGFPPNTPRTVAGYRTDKFGLYVEKGTTEQDIQTMCKKYGCKLDDKLNTTFKPWCSFLIGPGQSLEQVIREVLANEPKVTTIHLSYVERKLP